MTKAALLSVVYGFKRSTDESSGVFSATGSRRDNLRHGRLRWLINYGGNWKASVVFEKSIMYIVFETAATNSSTPKRKQLISIALKNLN